MIRPHPTNLLLALAMLACAVSVRAQQLVLSTTVNPPYTANYVQYFQNPQQITLFVRNEQVGAQPRDIYLAGSIATLDGHIAVRIEGGQPWNAPPLHIPVGVTTRNGADLQSFVTNSGGQVQYTGISEEDIRLGLLPEGEYQLCLQAFDYFTNEPLSDGAPSDGCSNIFTVSYPPPPELLTPHCAENVPMAMPQNVLFNWVLPSGPPVGAVVQYHFKLVLLPEDPTSIDPLSALESSNDPVWENTALMAPALLYGPTMPSLITGRSYAWYVRAVDINGQHTFQNDGWSQPCTFMWGHEFVPWTANTISGGFQLTYPVLQDTLPWDLMPVIVRFGPHAAPDTTKEFSSTLDLNQNGSFHSTTRRKGDGEPILWNSGPYLSQRYLLYQAVEPDPPFTPEQANHINVYSNDVQPSDRFVHGDRYQANVHATIAKKNGHGPIEADVSTQFVSGMGRPRPIAPANATNLPAVQASGTPPITLRFRTADAPQAILPQYPIWIIENGQVTQTQGTVDERWVLRIARDEAFTDVVHTADGRVGEGLRLNDPACAAGCLESALYKEESTSFTPTANGTYYWQVAWLTSTDDLTSSTYHQGPVWRFTLGETDDDGGGGTTTTTGETEEIIPSAECLADCRRTPTPPAQCVSVSNILAGDTVQVGLFKMKLTNIGYGAGNAATGEGIIHVPVMKAALRVRFTNVHINAQKRLFNGTVNGLYDNEGVIPSAWTTGSSLAIGFNPTAAQAIDEYLNTAGRLVSQFSGNTPMGLPIGIDKETPAGRLVIGILGIQFTDTMARLNAGMALPMHDLGETLGLGNMAIPFHPGGIGDLSEEGTLYLLGDARVPLGEDTLKLKGARFVDGFTTVQDSGTFVAWDCNGFRAATIDLEYRFSRNKLREDLANGEDGPQKVVGSMRVRTGRGGIMGRMDLNVPFHLTEAKSWGFDLQEAWLDLTSYANPPDMRMPPSAFEDFFVGNSDGTVDPSWTGVYVKRAMLRMPPAIERFDATGRVTAMVDDLIYGIGDGLYAEIKVANLLGTDQGKLDGWGFSLDTLHMNIVRNTLNEGGFSGRIRMPFTDTLLVYSGMVQHDPQTEDTRMEFLLHPDGVLNVPMYVAHAELLETSTIRAVFGDAATGSSARAELNGKLSVDVNGPGKLKINFRDIAFQGLYFQTDDPYTNAGDNGVFSLASPQKFMGMEDGPTEEEEEGKAGGFPISITRVTTERRNSEGTVMAGLGFDINLDLSGATNTFVATTRIALLGELNTQALHKWGHHDIELDSIGVTGETGAVKIVGGLRWYHDDPTYGNGINGRVHAWFMKGALEVAAAAQFGTVNGTRYWFADAMVAKDGGFSPGSAFNIYGFGGGAWYHMRQMSEPPNAEDITNDQLANADEPDHQPGFTLSQVVYRPDANIAFGFKATVLFGDGASGRAYNGDLTASMQFSASGGVETASLDGNVYLMRKRDSDQNAYKPIWGNGQVRFDFPNDRFTANFNMYVKLHAGVLAGTGPDYKAGSLELLIDPDTWHLFVGTPQTPIGLNFNGLFTATAYFMVGQDLPPALLPDSALVLAMLPAGYFDRSDASNASGIAFGARADLKQDFNFYLLRMRLQAGLGFDIAFTPADELECSDNPDPGIAGFYATGQIYAYLAGSVSLHIDVWFAEGDYEILSLAAAAMLQGGFADPSYVRGAVGGSYSILGGLVDGHFTFPFEAGEPCQAFGSDALAGLEPIGDITPRHGSGISSFPAVPCGVNPEVAMNMKLDTPFPLKQINANGSASWYTYRLKLDSLVLKLRGVKQDGTIEIASSKEQVLFLPDKALDPFTTYTFKVRLRVEKKTEGGGWNTAMYDGHPAIWDSIVTFKTGEGIKVLTPELLDFTYPFVGQRYLLQDECRNGIIRCKQKLNGIGHLFNEAEVPANKVRVYRMVFTPLNGGASINAPATVSHGGRSVVEFNVPQLQNGRTYVAQLISRDSTVQRIGIGNQYMPALPDIGIMSMSSVSSTSLHGGMARVFRRQLTGYNLRNGEKLLFTYHFATSKHSTIAAKAAALTAINVEHTKNAQVPPQESVSPSFSGEPFDVFDLNGYKYRPCDACIVPPLITVDEARIDPWNNDWAKPLIYDYYAGIKERGCSNLDLARSTAGNIFGIPMIQDSPDTIGIPPVHTVTFHPYNPVRSPLSASETAPPSPFAVSTAGMGVAADAGTGVPQTKVLLNVRTGKQTRADYIRMGTISADAISYCGHLDPVAELGMPEPLRSKAIAFENSTFKLLYKTNYGAKFLFNPPPSCDVFLDWSQSATPQNSGIATYYLATGALPTHSPAGAGVPGGGAIQIRP